MNALEKVVDLLAATVLLFLLPLLYYGSGKTVSQAVLAGQAGEVFLKRISTAGEITLPVWKDLERNLLQCGCESYDFRRERVLYRRVEETGEVMEQVNTAEKEKLYQQITETGESNLLSGDRLWLTLYVNEIPAVYFSVVRTGVEYL